MLILAKYLGRVRAGEQRRNPLLLLLFGRIVAICRRQLVPKAGPAESHLPRTKMTQLVTPPTKSARNDASETSPPKAQWLRKIAECLKTNHRGES